MLSILKIYCNRRGWYLSQVLQTKIELQIKALIYDKISNMPSLGLKYFETGMVSNLLTQDIGTISINWRFLMTLMVIPVVVIFTTIVLCIRFSWVGLFMPVIFFALVYLQMLGNKIMHAATTRLLKHSDQRGKILNESIAGIKNIKFNAWENLVFTKTSSIRSKETSNAFIYMIVRFFINGFSDLIAVFLNLTIILIYSKYVNQITLSDVLVLISYGNMVQMPTKYVVVAFSTHNGATVSFSRLNKLLFTRLQENVVKERAEQKGEVILDRLTTGWTVLFLLCRV